MKMQNLNEVFEEKLRSNELPEEVPEIEPPKKFKKSTIIIIVSIMLLISLGYIVNDKLVEPYFEEKNMNYYYQGQLDLYVDLINELSQCKQVPLQLNNNQTANAILVECLQ